MGLRPPEGITVPVVESIQTEPYQVVMGKSFMMGGGWQMTYVKTGVSEVNYSWKAQLVNQASGGKIGKIIGYIRNCGNGQELVMGVLTGGKSYDEMIGLRLWVGMEGNAMLIEPRIEIKEVEERGRMVRLAVARFGGYKNQRISGDLDNINQMHFCLFQDHQTNLQAENL